MGIFEGEPNVWPLLPLIGVTRRGHVHILVYPELQSGPNSEEVRNANHRLKLNLIKRLKLNLRIPFYNKLCKELRSREKSDDIAIYPII